jgi:hypothetical protein
MRRSDERGQEGGGKGEKPKNVTEIQTELVWVEKKGGSCVREREQNILTKLYFGFCSFTWWVEE